MFSVPSSEKEKVTVSRALRILIVENNEDCATSTAMLLRSYGHEAAIARSGPEALRSVEGSPPDLVMIDLGLPGMNGYMLATELLQNSAAKRPMLMAVTGYGQDSDRHRSAEAGIDLHLVKPVDPRELREILRLISSQLTASQYEGNTDHDVSFSAGLRTI